MPAPIGSSVQINRATSDHWNRRRFKESAIQLITLVSCGVLDEYVQATNGVPKYMFVPEFSDVEIVQ